jgi:hypothetical protein
LLARAAVALALIEVSGEGLGVFSLLRLGGSPEKLRDA